MSGKENEKSNTGKKVFLAILTLGILGYITPNACQMIKQATYRGRLNQLVSNINRKIDEKVAMYDESFMEMYSYTQDSLTPISYVFSRNSCQEKINVEKYKQNIMPSKCVDNKYISTSNVCLIHIEPAKFVDNQYYYMVYLDLDCKKGKLNDEYYRTMNTQSIDRYARDPYYDDVLSMIFEQTGENFYLKPFPDKSKDYYKKYHMLVNCKKGLFYTKKCDI